MFTNLIATCG